MMQQRATLRLATSLLRVLSGAGDPGPVTAADEGAAGAAPGDVAKQGRLGDPPGLPTNPVGPEGPAGVAAGPPRLLATSRRWLSSSLF